MKIEQGGGQRISLGYPSEVRRFEGNVEYKPLVAGLLLNTNPG